MRRRERERQRRREKERDRKKESAHIFFFGMGHASYKKAKGGTWLHYIRLHAKEREREE